MAMAATHFPIVIITGRPAAGKSEVIDYLKNCEAKEREKRFHIGQFEELDDFVYVWETFEIDDILSRYGKPRLWTDSRYYFTDPFIWNLYIETDESGIPEETRARRLIPRTDDDTD